MRVLLNALVWHVTPREERSSDPDPETERLRNLPEWDFNVKAATRRLARTARAMNRTAPKTFKDVYLALARGCPLCPSCRTPILIGCKVDGHRVNRGREFCDDACKMHAHRRRPDAGPA